MCWVTFTNFSALHSHCHQCLLLALKTKISFCTVHKRTMTSISYWNPEVNCYNKHSQWVSDLGGLWAVELQYLSCDEGPQLPSWANFSSKLLTEEPKHLFRKDLKWHLCAGRWEAEPVTADRTTWQLTRLEHTGENTLEAKSSASKNCLLHLLWNSK